MSFVKFYRIQLFLEYVKGEYWIDSSGEPWYADGDVSDVNHSNYIISIVTSDILNELNVEVRDEQLGALNYYYDQIFKEIEDQLSPELLQKWEDRDQEEVILHLIGDTPQNRDKISASLDSMDPRDYGLKYLGYKRVKGNYVQTFTMTPRDFEVIKRGIGGILEQERVDDEQLKDHTINIEVMANRHYYGDVPYSVVLDGHIQDLLQYRS